MMKRIAIIGAGNAGCITALHYYYHGHDSFDITIYHNPSIPHQESPASPAVLTLG